MLEVLEMLSHSGLDSSCSTGLDLCCIFRDMMHQRFSVVEGSGLQAGQFSAWTLSVGRAAVMMQDAVCVSC